jgi:hypothetical protein
VVKRTERASGGKAADGRNEEWLAGFRIGLALADRGAGKVLRRVDRIDVFDGDGGRILSCRVADLPQVER